MLQIEGVRDFTKPCVGTQHAVPVCPCASVPGWVSRGWALFRAILSLGTARRAPAMVRPGPSFAGYFFASAKFA
jgi:hypothetical protein